MKYKRTAMCCTVRLRGFSVVQWYMATLKQRTFVERKSNKLCYQGSNIFPQYSSTNVRISVFGKQKSTKIEFSGSTVNVIKFPYFNGFIAL